MSTQAMPDAKIPVALTHASSEKLSRHEMLRWINTTVQGEYTKIEDLCSGVAYCQMMEMLFPNSVGMKKIKVNAKLEHEFLHNLKLFQMAFTRINYEKSVPIERLIKGRFQDNFEFLQWFKKFYDVHAAGKENMKLPNTQKPQINLKTKTTKKVLNRVGSEMTPPTANSTQLNADESGSPRSLKYLQETRDKLAEQTAAILNERNFYYKKLLDVENVLKEFTDHDELRERALAILYANDGETPGNGNNESGSETAEL
ncbi:PREDICTED: microtubule-associated protein RP/EB family member 2 isoform X1 [Bactrocera latifrons]|uniref:Microtubule-associated protein RP/EB family member 1 n=1 Tax=Bactrocera latifrons TaxID=174628 RepID=A0A0K8V2J1_BACLA|nr:PREDICTED: microtubule-associated protein RP/EB family member 2 isoform X1 [Bactrocera latifrons]